LIVVLDTNIWISALQFGQSDSTPVRALDRAMAHDVIAIADELEIEILVTLVRKFKWSQDRASEAINLVLKRAIRRTI
jgi:predicted nucleic acid-binding protein